MKLLKYDLIKGNIAGNSKFYGLLKVLSTYYPYLSLPANSDNMIQVLVNTYTLYNLVALQGYFLDLCKYPTQFIIYYTNSNKTFINNAPSEERFTFESGKNYIYEPLKNDPNDWSNWVKRGKFIDYDTGELIGYDYEYRGPMY